MKLLIITLVILLSFSVTAHADLNLIGQGTSTHGTYNLIYDTDLDVTWYDYTKSYDRWEHEVQWADGLSVNFGVNTYEDWRLPIMFDESCDGYNCTNSEMGHLYYTELGNVGEYDTSGNPTGCGAWMQPNCLTNTGDFQNLQASVYWSGTERSAYPHLAWYFVNYNGYQISTVKTIDYYAIAVRPGRAVATTVVPEPISSTLFIVGGATLGFRRFRKKFKK